MTKTRRKLRKWNTALRVAIALLVVGLIGGGSYFLIRSNAEVNELNAVHIDPSQIESKTKIIGTHLIYIDYLTDELNEIAQASVNESGQEKLYYKSELGGDQWYEITNATKLSEIKDQGVPVNNQVIADLLLRYHTRSDGKTIDLLTGEEVSIFDIKSPYDLSALEQLTAIKTQYENLQAKSEGDRSETDKRDLNLLQEFFSLDMHTEQTSSYDDQLATLQRYYKQLKDEGADDTKLSKVTELQGKVDAARRAIVFEQLNETYIPTLTTAVNKDNVYTEGEIRTGVNANEAQYVEAKKKLEAQKTEVERLQSAYNAETDAFRKTQIAAQLQSAKDMQTALEEALNNARSSDGARVDPFTLNTSLLESINNASSECISAQTEYESKAIAQGSSIIAQEEYATILSLIQNVIAGRKEDADHDLATLISLGNISASKIVDGDAELAVLNDTLMNKAQDAYDAKAGEGTGEAYNSLPGTATQAARTAALNTQKNEMESVRSEMQFIIQAKIDRLTTEDGITFVKQLIDEAHYFSDAVHQDEFEVYAKASVDEYKLWLQQKLEALQAKAGDQEADALKEKLDALDEQYKEALDNDQLDEAGRLDAEREAAKKSLDDYNQRQANIINNPNASASEKAEAAAKMTDGSAENAMNDMMNDALNALQNGDTSGDALGAAIDGIASLSQANPQQALSALSAIQNEMNAQALMNPDAAGALADLNSKLEDATSGVMSNLSANFSDQQLQAAIDAFLAEHSGDGLSENELMASLLIGLNMYVEDTGAENVLAFLIKLAAEQSGKGNIYLYSQLQTDLRNKYIDTDHLAQVTGYRYIFKDDFKEVVLRSGSDFYSVQAFSNQVGRPQTDEEMALAAGFQQVVYVDAEYAYESFGYDGVYLVGTQEAVLADDEMQELALAFYDYLMGIKNTRAA